MLLSGMRQSLEMLLHACMTSGKELNVYPSELHMRRLTCVMTIIICQFGDLRMEGYYRSLLAQICSSLHSFPMQPQVGSLQYLPQLHNSPEW